MDALSGPTDAELVARVLQADREAFAQVYDRYGPRLYDFAYSMLRHPEDAADSVADSFVSFAEKLPQLREPDRLRPWLYAIVRSECLRRLKARKRVSYGDDEQLMAMADDALTPDQAAEQAALTKLVWDASAGLADRDRALLDLHLRQGLEGAELGEAMGVSASNAYVMLNRLKAQVDRSLGALLIARLGRDDCDDLDRLLADWDGTFSPLIRKRVARHVEDCEICGERRKKIVSPWMLLAGVPVFVAPLTLRDRVLNDTQLVAYAGAPSTASRISTRTKGAAAAAALVAAASVTAVVAWPDDEPDASSSAAQTSSPTIASPSTEPTPTATPSDDPSPTPSATPSQTPSAEPGVISLSTTTIDLGSSRNRASLAVRNTGGSPVDFTVAENLPWLRVAPASASVDPGEEVGVRVRADRSALPEGPASGSFQVRSEGRTFNVRVALTAERGPVLGAIITPRSPSCSVPVTVDVTDESRVTSVRLEWSGPSPGRAAMQLRSATSWYATAGQIDVGGTYVLKVIATDSRGNTSTTSKSLTINPCPQ